MELDLFNTGLDSLMNSIGRAINSPREKQLHSINVALIVILKGLFHSFNNLRNHLELQTNKFLVLNSKMATLNSLKQHQVLSLNNSSVENSEEIESEMFATVYDPQIEINRRFREQLEAQSADITALQKLLKKKTDMYNETTKVNEEAIKKLTSKLDMLKHLLKEFKVFKEKAVKPVSTCLSVNISSLDAYSYKQKYREMLKKVIAEASELRRTFIFTDEPMSNDELKAFKEVLIGMGTKNTMSELCIENAYISEGLWLSEVIANNALTLRRIAINKTLLDVTGAIKVLTAVKDSKVKLNELNLDENKLQGNDLNLLVGLFNGANIRRFSVRKNPLDIISIEKFASATKHLVSLEEIDVGDIEITERKELEWRTNYISLTFNKIYDC